MSTGSDTPRPVWRWRSLMLAWLAALSGATLLIAGLLWSARLDALRAAQVTALNHARTLEARLESSLRRTDAILHTLASSTPLPLPEAGDPRSARINEQLDLLHRHFEELLALRIVDAAADQRFVTDAATTPAANYADRSFFRRYREDPQADLLFSEVVLGRVSRRATMVVTVPLRGAGGALAGAVLAPLDLGLFEQQYQALDIGPGGVVSLRRVEDGMLVARWPHLPEEVNRPMPPDQPILATLRAGRNESLDVFRARSDGVLRSAGTVRVRGYPFFLTVAMSQDHVLANWRRLVWLTAAIWLALVGLSGLLLFMARRAGRQQEAAERRQRESARLTALGTLAGGIAHDFNNMVAAILGHVTLAQRALAPQDAVQAHLAQIRQTGLGARELVQQIMDFGHRQAPTLRAQALQPLLQEAAAQVRATLPPGMTLRCDWTEEALHARVDAAQLQRVVMNLCTNAWHATPQRPAEVVLGLSRHGEQLCLSVKDDGTGMDEATRARVFEPFFSTKPSGQGSGLGLSVVHGIVTAHGGQIEIDSAPGEGCTVRVWLPRVPAPEPGPQPVAPAAQARAATVPATACIFYVDDDEVLRLLMGQLLAQAGHDVRLFADGEALLQALQQSPDAADLVISDFNMPGQDGMAVARAVAGIRPGLPVIISSGQITDALRAQAQALGVRSLLPKQHLVEELLPQVQRALQAR